MFTFTTLAASSVRISGRGASANTIRNKKGEAKKRKEEKKRDPESNIRDEIIETVASSVRANQEAILRTINRETARKVHVVNMSSNTI
ncbi:hypothetical protein EVAR_25117_1 [Eumeta japonica]|uniref:Uncharacterized protein n=1 Tax=Eumeta variegata TaxID=151549 RepID=A0A4C1XJ73_EUMVA|nr:hypothetical protein EVAR_25117_1 [Eumeta japonica]